ncbi:unnamed protein product [Paramecium sonneborni]|uniref:Uncharacterized protein n=1 Tax=Paramecium sonneborni TaxID=65129 RepID=A0A8S1JXN9_9CILI|nr:unnamed protein product [Paramecium sonneborni]
MIQIINKRPIILYKAKNFGFQKKKMKIWRFVWLQSINFLFTDLMVYLKKESSGLTQYLGEDQKELQVQFLIEVENFKNELFEIYFVLFVSSIFMWRRQQIFYEDKMQAVRKNLSNKYTNGKIIKQIIQMSKKSMSIMQHNCHKIPNHQK